MITMHRRQLLVFIRSGSGGLLSPLLVLVHGCQCILAMRHHRFTYRYECTRRPFRRIAHRDGASLVAGALRVAVAVDLVEAAEAVVAVWLVESRNGRLGGRRSCRPRLFRARLGPRSDGCAVVKQEAAVAANREEEVVVVNQEGNAVEEVWPGHQQVTAMHLLCYLPTTTTSSTTSIAMTTTMISTVTDVTEVGSCTTIKSMT
mmetsp:Transcript_35658/g.78074  ORF Transcript_35658/g.78074 Transcript_35658/m.78074 type:complete len:203 (+) Transcript_35658:340-948(+)